MSRQSNESSVRRFGEKVFRIDRWLMKEEGSFNRFVLIWLGQVISLIGSGLTAFSLNIWIYQQTGKVTDFAVSMLFTILPVLILSPVAGVVVDRSDYRRLMVFCDTLAALSSLGIAIIYSIGHLQLWHIYLAIAVNASCGAFQQPAYTALTSFLVPQSLLGRAGGMLQAGFAASDILSPVIAGVLVVAIGLNGVILIDVITFLFAVGILIVLPVPKRKLQEEQASRQAINARTIAQSFVQSWQFISQRPGLAGLLVFSIITNFAIGTISALLVPLLLTLTTVDQVGTIISITGFGMLAGSLGLSLWGGPKKRINGVLGFEFIKGLGIFFIGLQPRAAWVALSAVLAHFALPISNGLNQAIWQACVPQEKQGSVFSFRQMITRSMVPVAYIIVGPVADRILEPLMLHPVGMLSLLGSGSGRGMGLIFVMMGMVTMLISVVGMLTPSLKNVESE